MCIRDRFVLFMCTHMSEPSLITSSLMRYTSLLYWLTGTFWEHWVQTEGSEEDTEAECGTNLFNVGNPPPPICTERKSLNKILKKNKVCIKAEESDWNVFYHINSVTFPLLRALADITNITSTLVPKKMWKETLILEEVIPQTRLVKCCI